jgi:hypothetical protein
MEELIGNICMNKGVPIVREQVMNLNRPAHLGADTLYSVLSISCIGQRIWKIENSRTHEGLTFVRSPQPGGHCFGDEDVGRRHSSHIHWRYFMFLYALKGANYSCPWGARNDSMSFVGIAYHSYRAWIVTWELLDA